MAKGMGFGKTILFGEHFVVYGLPAIASAIGDCTVATVEPAERMQMVDARPATPGYKLAKKEEMRRQLDALFKHFGVDAKKPVKITLSGNLLCTGGVGASAALATSVSRAFNELYGLGMSDDEINKAAYISEEAGSGKPSGIDNTCSTYGGMIWFRKDMGGGQNAIERIKVRQPVEVVLGNTGITQDTKAVVEEVTKKREQNKKEYDRLFQKYSELAGEARQSVRLAEWETVGSLMDKNHELLRKINVSCDKLEELILISKESGALGAKLTGTGRGGYMIALTPGRDLQAKVACAMESAGFGVLKTTIG